MFTSDTFHRSLVSYTTMSNVKLHDHKLQILYIISQLISLSVIPWKFCKSFGIHLSENQLDTSFSLLFGRAPKWTRKANICPQMTKNAIFWPNLAVFGPKILIFKGGSKNFCTHISGDLLDTCFLFLILTSEAPRGH